jgi:hypothetical protein
VDEKTGDFNALGVFDKLLLLKLPSDFNLRDIEWTIAEAFEYLKAEEVEYDRRNFDTLLCQMLALKDRMTTCNDESALTDLDVNIELCKLRKDALKLLERFHDAIDIIRSMEDKVIEQSFYSRLKRSITKSNVRLFR